MCPRVGYCCNVLRKNVNDGIEMKTASTQRQKEFIHKLKREGFVDSSIKEGKNEIPPKNIL